MSLTLNLHYLTRQLKFVFLFVEGLKSEPVLDINELKSMGLIEKIKIGETISVLLEKIEDKNGEVF